MSSDKNELWWDVPERRDKLLRTVLNIPSKIMNNHEVDGLSQLVLHELGHDFWLKRASFLVDNPDFDCLTGVAGYHHDECKFHKKDIWSDPLAFEKDMQDAKFHRSVKDFSYGSSIKQRCGSHAQDDLLELGSRLGMAQPNAFVWDLRHGNHGILLFECLPDCKLKNKSTKLVEEVSALLGLCSS